MGKGARDAGSIAGPRHRQVACQPKAGHFCRRLHDGTILMVRINDGAEILVVAAAAEPVGAGVDAKGHAAGIPSEDGDAGCLEL